MQTFGSFFKDCRSKTGLSLRKYCEKFQFDAAQISRMERGLLSAPRDKEKLALYAKTLDLKENSATRKRFFDLASVSNRSIVDEIKTPAFAEKLPIFLRTIDNKNLNSEQLVQLLELIRKA